MCWGLILACHAACTTYAGLAICRTLLGAFESCVDPILILIIAMWYRKEEQGRRISWFYICNGLASMFGGFLAYGTSFAHTEFAPWRIFFLVIGIITIFIGALVCIFLPDSPVKAKRFSDAEKMAALIRVKDNQSGTQNAVFKKEQMIETFKDFRTWIVCICTLLGSIPNGGISSFSNILLTTFGYSARQALIISTPGGIISAIIILITGYLSDRWRDRSLTMLIPIIPTIIAGSLMIGLDYHNSQNKAGLLVAYYIAGTSTASFMLLLAWNASNIAGHTKKVTINTITLIAYAVGNILGTQTFQAKQAPGYISGKVSIVATLVALCFMIFVLRFYNIYLNKKNRKTLENMSEREKAKMMEKLAFADQTDRKNPFFVYTY
ncbi:major facilitator superfamily domain-containing protein [Xylogone sp. PMI_703]|nr:major facilitator superfamily domain-containing protein [Xylogone sp. PMI_703]